MKESIYRFEPTARCEMCGDPSETHKVLGSRLNRAQGLRPKTKIGIAVSVAKCGACGLVYPNPLPVPFDIQDHYGVPPEDYFYEDDLEHSDNDYFARQIKAAKELLPFRDGMTALDIGAGVGRAMIAMERAGFLAYGVEPSAPFYDRAVKVMNISPDRLRFNTIEDAEYASASFDFITYGAVFEHLYHPAETLRKALAWLKPGGLVHIEVPSAEYTMTKLFNLYLKFTGTSFTSHISPMHAPFHLYEFTLKSFSEAGKRLGFKVVHHTRQVGSVYHIPKPLGVPLQKYMQMTDKGMQLTVYLRKTS